MLPAEQGLTQVEARDLLVTGLEAQTERQLNAAEWSVRQCSYGIRILLQHLVGTFETMIRGSSRLILGPGRSPVYLRLGELILITLTDAWNRLWLGLQFVILVSIYVGATAMRRSQSREPMTLLTILVLLPGHIVWA